MEIVLVGLNHRTAPVEVREKVSFTAEQARRAAEELRARGILEETLVLSTCNRSEVYGVPPEFSHECAPGLSTFLSEFHSVRADVLSVSLYHHYDHEAVRHLFRVAAGLDSMLLGEAEILGQVREAYRFAHEHGATGPVLNRLFQGALEVGKRVRTETELGTRPMSVASAGVKLAERIFGKLHERKALVLGAGTVSEQVVSQLRDRGIAQLYVMNRSRDRAEELAKRFEGKVVGWGEWDSALQSPDVVVSSVSVEEPLLRREILERAMAARGNRALFLMDLGVPRNIAPDAAELYNVYVYHSDDLSEIVQQNRSARESEIPKAQGIVDEHVAKFLSWQASVDLVGLVDALRVKMREERASFIRARMESMKHLTETERAHVEKLMDEMLEKLLLEPAERLRGEKELRRKIQNVEALRDLFLSYREKP
ncbi:MAG: glutamyl-tRNA reductase [Acidobacteria bacterium 13_2_20CM_2_57_6]|jgi:glutamyl-tRNA reductase|nr:MAG: glutamyl-tRNA reductase [Acidobacteria bacterium 13_2_20CM_57_7]OLB84051.1 MAG: glutamyl-tRNA reductase [Acidobacteria bacterium 13_2_20CM_2_57_6]PYT39133.1 MAG: glutamyl-tRNA reductase [Acidobacteriota bacterium]